MRPKPLCAILDSGSFGLRPGGGLVALAAVLGIAATWCPAAEPGVSWATGPAVRQQLASTVGVFWSGVPLRQAVTHVCASRRLAILLDRRVDPDRKLTVQAADVPLEELLGQVADQHGLAVTVLGPVVYLGPPEAASRLRTLSQLRHDEVRRLPAAAARRFTQLERIRWGDFAAPRDLLAQLAKENGLAIHGLELVPHDLWAAADLPPLALVDRLSLIAVQFDLTFAVSEEGATVRLAPVPEQVAIDRDYPAGANAAELARKWAEIAPDARIRVLGGKIVVRGTVEDHEQIAASLRPGERAVSKGPGDRRPRRPNSSGAAEGAAAPQQRFTVKETRGPVGSLATELAGKLGLEVRFDQKAIEEAGISLQEPVVFSVKDATVDELLRAVLSPAGLAFRRSGKAVQVFPER